eukprot:jgi/Picre1/34295/NNA_001768.t1
MSFQEKSGTQGYRDLHESRPLWSSVEEEEDEDIKKNTFSAHCHKESENNAQKWLKIWAAAACLARLVIPSSFVLVVYIVTDYTNSIQIYYMVYIFYGAFLDFLGCLEL